jgi:hypothetical protein
MGGSPQQRFQPSAQRRTAVTRSPHVGPAITVHDGIRGAADSAATVSIPASMSVARMPIDRACQQLMFIVHDVRHSQRTTRNNGVADLELQPALVLRATRLLAHL